MPEGRASSSSDYRRVGVFNRWRQYTATGIADSVEAPKGNRLASSERDKSTMFDVEGYRKREVRV